MRIFHCDACGELVYFENTSCLNCGTALAYLPAGADVNALTYDQLLAWAKAATEKTGKRALGFPAGPKGLMHRFFQGYLYPSFTGGVVSTLKSADAEAGWTATEVGRQPWIVYQIQLTRDAVSTAPGLRVGFYLVLAVYLVLTVMTVYVLRRLARAPEASIAPQELETIP